MTTRDLPRRVVRALVRRLGFDLIRYPTRRRTLEEAFEQLRRVGVRPATVIDVGVGQGTPELYRLFPRARFLLIEPVAEFEPKLRSIVERVEGEYALVAAASRGGSVRLRVAEDNLEASTVLDDPANKHRGLDREVGSARIDDLVSDRGFEPPFLVKVDTQGSELDVLSGAERTLRDTEAVVLEVSLFDFFKGMPQLADVVEFMKERGFVAYDFVGGHERPLDRALAQLDVVFVSEDGICRQTSRYSA